MKKQNTTTPTEVVVTVQLGRPVNPTSERQKRLAAFAEREKLGVAVKRGRPVVSDSDRQKRLAEQAERAAANGGVARRGRPVNSGSARQSRLADREAKIAGGVEIKRGRPATTKLPEVK
jgi:hypothetical protein